jgi:hypothetical protein
MSQVLRGEIPSTQEDNDLAQAIRIHFQGLMMKVIAGKVLSEFDSRCLALANGDTITERDIGYVACLPSLYARAQVRQSVDERLGSSEPSYLDKVGAKVQPKAEILKCVFSQNWGCWYINALTDTNHVVFFSKSECLEVGSTVVLQGKVKSHRDQWTTQLSHVKILGKASS